MYMQLYWVETEDHCEDWFILARQPEEAQAFHEDNEGYLQGDAVAEEILRVPDEIDAEVGWPSEEVLLALGAKFIDRGDARVVEIGGRIFCEGLFEQSIRSLDDDRFETNGQGRVNGTPKTSRELN